MAKINKTNARQNSVMKEGNEHYILPQAKKLFRIDRFWESFLQWHDTE